MSTLELHDFERQISDLITAITRGGNSEEQIDVFAEKISGYKKDADRIELTKLLNAIDTLPAMLTYKHSLISGCITDAKDYYSGRIRFNWQSLAYLDEQPIAIRDLVEAHKYRFAQKELFIK